MAALMDPPGLHGTLGCYPQHAESPVLVALDTEGAVSVTSHLASLG